VPRRNPFRSRRRKPGRIPHVKALVVRHDLARVLPNTKDNATAEPTRSVPVVHALAHAPSIQWAANPRPVDGSPILNSARQLKLTSFPETLARVEPGRKQVLNVEDWAEIRRLRCAEDLPISQIARSNDQNLWI
jgi:hypothetical protein